MMINQQEIQIIVLKQPSKNKDQMSLTNDDKRNHAPF